MNNEKKPHQFSKSCDGELRISFPLALEENSVCKKKTVKNYENCFLGDFCKLKKKDFLGSGPFLETVG